MAARVLRFRSREQTVDAERLRDALQTIAREFAFVARYAEARKRDAIAFEAARLQSETIKLLHKVQP